MLELTAGISNAQNANSPVETNGNGIVQAKEIVQTFYQALKTGNRSEALKHAKPTVVNELLNKKELDLKWIFSGCEEPKLKDNGDIVCFYDFKGGGIGIFLRKTANEQLQIVSTYNYDEN